MELSYHEFPSVGYPADLISSHMPERQSEILHDRLVGEGQWDMEVRLTWAGGG